MEPLNRGPALGGEYHRDTPRQHPTGPTRGALRWDGGRRGGSAQKGQPAAGSPPPDSRYTATREREHHQMTSKSSRAEARRNLHIVRIDLAVLRAEIKPLHLYAQAHGTPDEQIAFSYALRYLDKIIIELDAATLFHPTLF